VSDGLHRTVEIIMLAYYLAADVSGLISTRLVACIGRQGAGLVQLTLLLLVGLAARVLVDVRRMIVPPRQQTG
jgi:hypothetical protein